MNACKVIVTPLVAGALLVASAVGAAAQETYTVKRGDTLSHIAARYDTTWPRLYELNRAIIKDPDLIYPGQVFTIAPDKADPPRAKAKSRHSTAKAGASIVRPATGQVTSRFGMRTHPITGEYKLHTGTDFAYGDGNAYAAKAGKVSVQHPGWAGNLVVISHGGGVVTRYAHLARVTVASGQHVNAGDVVGRIGERGLATGPHLHFEVLRDGQFIDPMAWLD